MTELLMILGGLVALYGLGLALVHPLARRWLAYWHGRGEANQFAYYRCESCRRVITHRRIRSGGCDCGAIRVRPAALRLLERGRLLWLPWTA